MQNFELLRCSFQQCQISLDNFALVVKISGLVEKLLKVTVVLRLPSKVLGFFVGLLEGYVLTGRHGIFHTYEAFSRIVDSMISQHAKWLKVTNELPWRKDIASLNYYPLILVCGMMAVNEGMKLMMSMRIGYVIRKMHYSV